jgi:hypothetical protein
LVLIIKIEKNNSTKPQQKKKKTKNKKKKSLHESAISIGKLIATSPLSPPFDLAYSCFKISTRTYWYLIFQVGHIGNKNSQVGQT